jgi:hypothetical protein
MVRPRIIKIHGALHQTQAEQADIKIEVPLRIAGYGSDVMKSGDLAVHHGISVGQTRKRWSTAALTTQTTKSASISRPRFGVRPVAPLFLGNRFST